ncbi:MAG: hypothetical protein KAR40_00120 [Candidatus Sabulitectum sp.]|nr:hypothetical protein [Candidatus Sabulitectum sp.]
MNSVTIKDLCEHTNRKELTLTIKDFLKKEEYLDSGTLTEWTHLGSRACQFVIYALVSILSASINSTDSARMLKTLKEYSWSTLDLTSFTQKGRLDLADVIYEELWQMARVIHCNE